MSSPLDRLLAPGIRLMQVARLPIKFAIISAAFLVPLCVAVYGVVSYSRSNVELARYAHAVRSGAPAAQAEGSGATACSPSRSSACAWRCT
jgi:hypothetical protein